MKKHIIFWIGLLGGVLSMQAQDSLSTYQRVILQQQSEQAFKKEYYYNPVHKLDYSNFSFSDILIRQGKEKRDLYQLQKGSGIEGVELTASSFKKLNNNRSIWGNVTYQNNAQKNIQWNNNLDLDLIGPYVIADSTKGSMKYEAYEFLGGYAKKIDKFSFALEVAYQAHLGYKSKDPRPKNISSNITIKGGVGYDLTANWTTSVHALYNNYTQNTDITFANQTQKAALYQMNGLGTWNRYFSGKTTGTNFEGNGYEYGVNLENKDLDFVVGFTKGSTKLKKFFKGVRLSNSTGDAEGNRLEGTYYSAFAMKFIQIEAHKVGLKYNYSTKEQDGIEIYYTDNESEMGLVKLLEKKIYKAKENSHFVEAMYEVNFSNSQLVAKPFWKYKKTTERLDEFDSKQNYTVNHYGLNLAYTHILNAGSALEIAPSLEYRHTSQSTSQYNLLQSKQSIEDWLANDFNYFTANYFAWGTTVKYAIEKVKKAPMFVAITYNQVNFKINKQNNYLGVTLGVTF